MNGFPLAKLGALVVVLGTTLLTFVSCDGPIGKGLGIKGHEFLRNTAEFDGLDGLAQLGDPFKGDESTGDDAPEEEASRDRTATPSIPGMDMKKGGRFFEGQNTWLHWLYIGLLALAAVAFFMPSGVRLLAVLGGAGIAGVVLFINRFNAMIIKDGAADSPAAMLSFDWDTGAYAAVIGFALILFDGVKGKPGRL